MPFQCLQTLGLSPELIRFDECGGQTPLIPNKNRQLVDSHATKNGVGWLVNTQQGKVCSFTNAKPTAHAQWVVVEPRPLRGGGQPVIRRMLRHNAIEAWEAMQKSGGWKRCQPRW